MKTLKISILLPAISLSMLLSGCIGEMFSPKEDPTQFFILQSTAGSVSSKLTSKAEINFYPISIPAYVARDQIVTLDAKSGAVSLSEIYRWAEPIRNGLTRVLTENIRRSDPNIRVFAYPEMSPSKHPCSLKVTILECIGELGGKLDFRGVWTLSIPKNKGSESKSTTKEFTIIQNCGNTHKTYIESINRSISKLADEILLELSKEN